MKATFFIADNRHDLPGDRYLGWRWRLRNLFEGYFILRPCGNLEKFLKLKSAAPPRRGVAFSAGYFGAGIRRIKKNHEKRMLCMS